MDGRAAVLRVPWPEQRRQCDLAALVYARPKRRREAENLDAAPAAGLILAVIIVLAACYW